MVFFNKFALIKINNFCFLKATLKQMKRWAIDWVKYLQVTYLIKDISRMYKELYKLNKKTTQFLKNGQQI